VLLIRHENADSNDVENGRTPDRCIARRIEAGQFFDVFKGRVRPNRERANRLALDGQVFETENGAESAVVLIVSAITLMTGRRSRTITTSRIG
jgi:hypothetical protein